MVELAALELPDDPKLLGNITHFARALRKAGIPIGPAAVLNATRAVQAAGFSEKTDFYWTLHACFVTKRDQSWVFSQVFRLYWRDPRYLEHMMAYMIPAVRGVQEERLAKPAEKRAAEALLDGVVPPNDEPTAENEETAIEIDASRTMSSTERLRQLDFEQMSTSEMQAAKRMIARLKLPVKPLQSRRTQAALTGAKIDGPRTLRAAMRQGGDVARIARQKNRARYPNLVALCDISGSMSQYSRAVLHFLHAVTNEKGAGWARVHAFTFGTRLTNITRHMGARDVDAALKSAGAQAQDWEGGTRIGDCLTAFNRDWSRRVMGQGAIVLLISDGLDRGDPDRLGAAMHRLHLSAKRVIWLNPLMRFEEFAPKARGIAAMLPHVDSFRAGHNIASLEGIAAALNGDAGDKSRMMDALK